MDRIPPIAPRSRFEPPLAPARLARVSRERREQSSDEGRKPPPRRPPGEQSGPDDEGGGAPHIDVHA